MTVATQAQEPKNVETITLDGDIFDASSLTEVGVNLLNSYQNITARLQQKESDVFIIRYAQAKIIDELKEESKNFKKIGEATKEE